ncbi:TPA: HEAT repeat domain-containing protein [Legionella pneumophila]|nr:HEAT repeat domain-containing protein [Legionella pneumophila]HDV5806100.1 HEAT repeat domain-containing protein [Legionella pneumophila]
MMITELQFNLLVYFIVIEFIIILFFIISSYISKLYFFIKNKRNQRAYDKLKELILHNKPIPSCLAKKTEIVLRLLKEIKPEDIPGWEEKRIEIVRDVILPRARSFINKRSWEKRYLLLLCFDYCICAEDHDSLIQLIKDNNTIISFNAMKIASKIGSSDLLKTILDKLKTEAHIFHAFAAHFLAPAPEWPNTIGRELTSTDDPWLKKICYEILRVTGSTSEYFDFTKADCYSENINVRLAAIRVLPYMDKNRYLEIYNLLIDDENWMVRNAIVKTLRELQDPEALNLLERALTDNVWWVRINAAKTLSYYGDAGQQILAKYLDGKNKEISGEADYFIKIQQIRDEASDD